MIKEIIKKIQARSLHLTVLGSGYVGLSTAALFADAGFNVIAVDIKPEIVKAVNNGVSLVNEPGLNELVSRNVQACRLKAILNSTEALNQADVVIISVQTPIDQDKKPILSFLANTLKEVGASLKKGMLVVISSTVPPGTVVEKAKPILESLSNLNADIDFYLAYMPERVAPGNALKEFVENPRLAGGVGSNSAKVARELFRTCCKEVIETDVATAEVAKLAENTFRDVNVAFANELALLCEKWGVDVLEVIRLANTHPRVKIHCPGAGVGGPCLPKDPYLLLHSGRSLSFNSKVILGSRYVNDYMPTHVVELVIKGLSSIGKNVKKSKVSVLGTAYKKGVGDSRLSPSEKVIKRLLSLGSDVVTYDPYCKDSVGAKRAKRFEEAVRNSDCVIIMVNHLEFRDINLSELKRLMNNNPVLIDGSRVVDPNQALQKGFGYYGIGWGRYSKKGLHP